MNIILDHFPNLSDDQKNKFLELEKIYKFWNSKINVISRKDIDNIFLHHILHSLSIAKFVDFTEEALVPVLINALKEQENNYNELEKSLEILEKEILKK